MEYNNFSPQKLFYHLFFQDAHEFLSQCLDQLKEDVEKVNKSCRNETSAWDESQGTRLGEETDTSRVYTCPVTVNMEFEVQHTIMCKRLEFWTLCKAIHVQEMRNVACLTCLDVKPK